MRGTVGFHSPLHLHGMVLSYVKGQFYSFISRVVSGIVKLLFPKHNRMPAGNFETVNCESHKPLISVKFSCVKEGLTVR
jgi:hypothetical protein